MQFPTATKSKNSSSCSGKTGSRQLGTGKSSPASAFATRTTLLSLTQTQVGSSQMNRRLSQNGFVLEQAFAVAILIVLSILPVVSTLCPLQARLGMHLVHDCSPILEQEEVREQSNVLGCVLDLVPLALHAWTEIPVARRPSTYPGERLQVGVKVLADQTGLIVISISDRIHDETHADDASAVNQTGARRRQIPGFLKRIGSRAPICLEDSKHRLHVPSTRIRISKAIQNSVAQAVLKHLQHGVILHHSIPVGGGSDLPFERRVRIVIQSIGQLSWESPLLQHGRQCHLCRG